MHAWRSNSYVPYVRCSVTSPPVVHMRSVRWEIMCDHVSLWERGAAPSLEVHITAPLTTPPTTSKAPTPTSQQKAATSVAHGSPTSLWWWKMRSGSANPQVSVAKLVAVEVYRTILILRRNEAKVVWVGLRQWTSISHCFQTVLLNSVDLAACSTIFHWLVHKCHLIHSHYPFNFVLGHSRKMFSEKSPKKQHCLSHLTAHRHTIQVIKKQLKNQTFPSGVMQRLMQSLRKVNIGLTISPDFTDDICVIFPLAAVKCVEKNF